MQTNPYSPPKAPLSDPPKPPGSPLKAVILGLAVDIGGSFLLSMALSIGYAMVLSNTGMSESEIMESMGNPPSDSLISILGMLGGGTLSVVGGFVCARVSRRSDYRLGFILGGLSAVFGLLLSYDSYSLPAHVLLTSLTFACVLLGTKLGRSTPIQDGETE